MTNKLYYLDNNATTPIDPEVVKAMQPYLNDSFFNPSSQYVRAKEVRDALENARREIANFIGAKELEEIIFTGSASESNNTAIRTTLAANPTRKHIITTNVEHPAIFELCKSLEKEGYEVTYLKVNPDGALNVVDLINAIRKDTAIVSIMHANNETGVIFPIDQLSKIVKKSDQDIVFHTDATQSIGKLLLNLERDLSYVDLLSFSGHKIHAPKGIGVLYKKKNIKCSAFIKGGHQEQGLRAGTENVPYIIGLAKACKNAKKYMKESDNHILYMRDELEKFIEQEIPATIINGKNSPRLDCTANISFQSVEGESILCALDEYGIMTSTGSACSSNTLSTSHVLKAMKIPLIYANGSLRISFGRFNNKKDLSYILESLELVIKSLRRISPFWDSKNNTPLKDFAHNSNH